MIRFVSGALLALALVATAPSAARAETSSSSDQPREQVFLQLSGMG